MSGRVWMAGMAQSSNHLRLPFRLPGHAYAARCGRPQVARPGTVHTPQIEPPRLIFPRRTADNGIVDERPADRSTAEPDVAQVALRLYVAGDSAPSALARRQLKTLREQLGGDGWEVEVVDVFDRPDLAEEDRILATPVLIRFLPPPRLGVIGDLSDWRAVAATLNLSEGFHD
jgi:circadian clock protein KaiB